MKIRGRRVVLLALSVLASACDSGPEGPGFLSATLEGPVPLGAAIVEVHGEGIVGFEGAGSTHVYSAPTQPGSHRVVLIAESAGELAFKVKVQELRDAPPSATVVSASGGDNVPLATVQAFQVRIVR